MKWRNPKEELPGLNVGVIVYWIEGDARWTTRRIQRT